MEKVTSTRSGERTGPSGAQFEASESELGFRPLYRQVREDIMKRLIDGSWPPGMVLPSEMRLARELGVSQGTVRKALDTLAADNLLVRRQGRGTFVAEPEEGRILFQFFRLTSDDGTRLFPTSHVIGVRRAPADDAARGRLLIDGRARIWIISRIRNLGGKPTIVEEIKLPVRLFPDLDRLDEIPNNVYALYSTRYGRTIGRTEERIKAVSASPFDAEKLDCPAGTPLLSIDRIGFSLDEAPVEWRVSRCLTDDHHYLSQLR